MRNKEIRETAKQNDIFLWEIAQQLGIADATLSRWLRCELSDGEKNKILAIIDVIASEKGGT